MRRRQNNWHTVKGQRVSVRLSDEQYNVLVWFAERRGESTGQLAKYFLGLMLAELGKRYVNTGADARR